ncbi:MAG: hypothetical protein KKH88_04515 [Nanoarchaeota archaeon]|nr:hypothetical protein [Nanoarchaeota archaeon]
MTKNQKKVIEQPNAYSKIDFPFGSIAVAQIDARHEVNLTYWGNDRSFEQVIFQDGSPISIRVGSHYTRKVLSKEGLFPRNLLGLRKKETLEVMTAAEQSRRSPEPEQIQEIKYHQM